MFLAGRVTSSSVRLKVREGCGRHSSKVCHEGVREIIDIVTEVYVIFGFESSVCLLVAIKYQIYYYENLSSLL